MTQTKYRQIALLIITLLMESSLATAVLAQTPSDDEARLAFEQGVAAFSARNYSMALEAFSQSYALSPKAVVSYNIAMCHKALLNYADAAEGFEKYLAEARDDDSYRLSKAKEALAELDRLTGWIKVEAMTDGAVVFVGSREIGTTPLPRPVRLGVGEHQLRVVHDGFSPFERTIVIKNAELLTINATLDALKKPAAPIPQTSMPEITAVETHVQNDDGKKNGLSKRGVAIVVAGLGLACVATGGVLSYLRQNSDVQAAADAIDRDDPQAHSAAIHDASVHEGWAIGAYVAGGALVVTAAVLMVVDIQQRRTGGSQSWRDRPLTLTPTGLAWFF